jgi:hypothetical protein
MSQIQQDREPIHQFDRFTLFAPHATGYKRAKLTWGVYKNNPRLTVFTNDENDKIKSGVIVGPMDPATFDIFVGDFLKIITDGQNGTKNKLECYKAVYVNEKPTNEKVLDSVIQYGKDENGICWVAVVAENRPKFKFNFKAAEFHKFYVNGVPMDEATGSRLTAIGTLTMVRDAMAQHCGKFYQPTNKPKSYQPPTKPFSKKPAGDDLFDDIPV